mmetsp:Transcript_101062/g.268665  ORF Transcript_101062/g.268665 Transcript_101062/m.268665 type:complete len:208 (-) Transcript_101062:240-863(-)
MVVHGVVLLEERDAKDEEGALRRRHVEAHEREGARRLRVVAVHVVFGGEVQVLAADDETQLRKRPEVLAPGLHVQQALELLHKLGGGGQLRGTGVHGHAAVLAKRLGLAIDGDVLDPHFPIAGGACHGHPKEVGCHVLVLDLPEGDLRLLLLGVREEDGEERLPERLLLSQAAHHAEAGALCHARQGQAQDPVEGKGGKRLVALISR